MNQSNKPSDTAPEFPKVPRYIKTPHHPVGLLYTMLHHGRGLSAEEAQRRSFEFTGEQPDKAA
ncbi:MAG: hypothetical protein Q7I92_03860 [Humidesulfovibrio sp.]|nr:hypothetical protein [Humidesulfovibrio sp.]